MNKKLLTILSAIIFLGLLTVIFSLNSKLNKLESKLNEIPDNSDFDTVSEPPVEENKANLFGQPEWYFVASDMNKNLWYADKASIIKNNLNSPDKIYKVATYFSKDKKDMFITFDCDNKSYLEYNKFHPISAGTTFAAIYNFACGDFSSPYLKYVGNHINQVKEEITDLANNKKCESYGKKLISCIPFSCTLTIGSGIDKYRIESKIKGLDEDGKCIEEESSSKDSTKTVCKYTINSRRFLGSKYLGGPLLPMGIKEDQEKYNKIQDDECGEIK